ncbi:MAG TPA: hypothetical protein VIG99_09515 [Myxococcaceae bacterium]
MEIVRASAASEAKVAAGPGPAVEIAGREASVASAEATGLDLVAASAAPRGLAAASAAIGVKKAAKETL